MLHIFRDHTIGGVAEIEFTAHGLKKEMEGNCVLPII